MDIDKPALPQVAGYTTEAVLGEGGMATVYLAVQESLSRYVALKVMNQILTVDGDFCRRFLNEGRLVAKLSHHNIVTVYDIGVSDRFHYLSMTYLPGGTLREKINRGLLLGQALHIVKCLADALGYAHRQGIVHRDIKPGNVLFTDNGGPVLTDFGIAKTVGNETRLTSTGMTVGSVGYMSPEQTLGLEVDHRSDLYSLGVLFWQMLTGALPYAAPDPFALALKHAKDPIPELPRPLDRFQPVIERLMAKKPEDRLASAEELVRIIDRIPCDDIRSHSSSDCDATIVLPRTHKRPPRKPGMATGSDGALEAAARRRLRVLGATIGIAGLTGVAAYVGYMAFSAPAPEASVPPPPAASVPAPAAEAATVASTSVRAAGTPTQKSVGPAEAFPDAQIGPAGNNPALPIATSPRGDPPLGSRAGQLGDIESLLRDAQRQWKSGRLTEPPGDNAFDTYSRVLDLDPEHPVAKEELVKIGLVNAANRVFLSADALLRQGAVEDARRMIETGLRMNPDDERLLGLRRALDYSQ